MSSPTFTWMVHSLWHAIHTTYTDLPRKLLWSLYSASPRRVWMSLVWTEVVVAAAAVVEEEEEEEEEDMDDTEELSEPPYLACSRSCSGRWRLLRCLMVLADEPPLIH